MPSPSNLSYRKFPLKKVFLRNFKSIRDSEVTISPLTVVVGANSSGKSSLLQSILSIQQAIGKELNGIDYPLNGERIRLGTFAETKSFFTQDSSEPIQIGFEVETVHVSFRSWDNEIQRMMRSPRRRSKYRASFKFDLFKRESEESGTARVGHISIESESKPEERGTAQVGHISIESKLREESISETPDRVLKLDLSFDKYPMLDNFDDLKFCVGNLFHSVENHTYSLSAVSFSGLLPTHAFEKGDNAIYVAKEVFNSVKKVFAKDLEKERGKPEVLLMSNEEIIDLEERVVEFLSPIFNELQENLEQNVDEEGLVSYIPTDSGKQFETEIKKLNSEKKQKLVKLVARSSVQRLGEVFDRSSHIPFLQAGSVSHPIGNEVANTMDDLSSLVKQVFRWNINYLAPVRLNPKVNYDPSSGRLDVGSTGEYTAYVLHTFGKRHSDYPLPNGASGSVSLIHAVNSWLEFFGLARGAKTIDNGRLGIGLRLNLLSGGHEVDLTSVGVGVSQVLPVLVSCLTAKIGAILLIEQPELHLHPKLQMDLADFLISCCQFGKQIIVETHSEHIINRIRRRIAEAENSELENLIGILFAEQSNGVTQYRSPSINKFGGLGSDWPEGFLDIGAGEMENLLGAGLNKRKKR